MTLILDLPPDLEARINLEAARRGVPLTACVMEILEAATTPETMTTRVIEDAEPLSGSEGAVDPPRGTLTGAQIVAKWKQKGLIGTRPDIEDSVAFVSLKRLSW